MHRLLLAAIVASVLSPALAMAAPQWHLSQPIGNDNGACAAGADGIRTQVGYFGEVTPRTGDSQDSAIVVVVQNGSCGPVTVIPEFRLPPGIAQDTTQAVECYRALSPNAANQPLSAFPSSQGACSSTPLPITIPNVFGWSRLDPGQRLEIYIPILYARPMTNGQLSVVVHNNFWELVPTITFSIDYLARFANFATNWIDVGTGRQWSETELTFSFRLESFFVAGQVYVDYGTTTNLGTSKYVGDTGAQYYAYPSVTTTVGGLTGGTTYYWRPRIVTPYGTSYGATQTGATCYRKQCARPRF
jgi:hypothetical protein